MGYPELTMSAWLRFDSIRRGLDRARPSRILEFGAGEGAFGVWLASRYDYAGVEPDETSQAVAAGRLQAAGQGTVLQALAPDSPHADTVCAFEVLEHIQDDAAALKTWREQLEPRGHLLISVPAHSTRFGVSDRYVGHYRRYDRGALQNLLEGAGFEILAWDSYGAGLGHLLDALRNVMLRRRSKTSTAAEGTALSGRLFQPKSRGRALVNYLVALPFRALQRPFASTDIGIGYVILARLR